MQGQPLSRKVTAMTTATLAPVLSLAEVEVLVADYVAVLNAQEVERRTAENAKREAAGEVLMSHGYSAEQYAHYTVQTGRRYHKVVQAVGGSGGSVHSFVERTTGDVYKAESWSRPARGVRYRLADQGSRERMYAKMGFAGGYLYAGAR